MGWYDIDSNKWKLVGVVSMGYGCGRPGFAGVYAKVTCVLDWIKEVTKLE